jgi:hypothetical protein
MSRTTLLVLVALGATLAGFALSSNTRRAQESSQEPRDTASAAGPQKTTLGWQETYGSESEHLVFSVESLEIRPDGWEAQVGLENASSASYEVGGPSAASGYTFGLMLMDTGELAELERRNENGTLPAVRRAVTFEPPLPAILDPGASWEGTMSAPGALVADSWARVVFGPLVSVGSAPEGLPEDVVWFTDSAYRLRR